MNERLRAYLDSKGAKTLTPENCEWLREYQRVMREETLPEIERNTRKQQQLAAELRFRPCVLFG